MYSRPTAQYALKIKLTFLALTLVQFLFNSFLIPYLKNTVQFFPLFQTIYNSPKLAKKHQKYNGFF